MPVQVGFGEREERNALMTSRCTSPVGAESTGSDEPTALTAVTRRRMVAPTSARTSLYVLAVAPATSVPPVPAAVEHRRHWYLNEVGEPLHVPFVPVRTS